MSLAAILDLIAVFIFALTGGLVASRAQLDIVGFLFLACLTGVGTNVGCSSGDVRRVAITPRRPLVPGEHYRIVVNPATAVHRVADRAGNPTPRIVRAFVAPTELEQGLHTIRIEVLGRSDPRATGRVISVDWLSVVPPAPATG